MNQYIQPPSTYGPGFAEAIVEDASLEILATLGYATAHGPDIAPDTTLAERQSYSDVILRQRLVAVVDRLNPAIPPLARAEAIKQVFTAATPSLVEENRRIHKLIVEGVDVEFYGDDGVIRGDKVRLIDFDDVAANDWLAVNQFTVIENRNDRRPDVVVFVNGLPLGVVELKNAGDETATLDGAFNQLQIYKAEIPSLFRTNAVLVISDGLLARVGSLTADRERFLPWRTVRKPSAEATQRTNGVFEACTGTPALAEQRRRAQFTVRCYRVYRFERWRARANRRDAAAGEQGGALAVQAKAPKSLRG